jgi:hypothetical protein
MHLPHFPGQREKSSLNLSITNPFSVSYYFNVAACGGHFDDLVLIVNP